ncbi:MAG: nucleoside permease [Luminiphilus sp.]|nr:nucleoside permease [Luminiphilus sp.]
MRYVHQRLSVMMFLQFFVWGSWFVTLGAFLGNNLNATGAETAMAFSTQSWGAIIAPLLVGLVADRYFNAERVLGLLHLTGAGLMFLLYGAADFGGFYPMLLAYMICYMPTLALVNSVAFRQLSDTAAQFGKIRLWGTIGWIVAGLMISFAFSWDSQQGVAEGLLKNTFMMAGIASLVLGVFSFTLPNTPPVTARNESSGVRQALGLDALSVLRDRNLALFFSMSVLICIPLAFYYQYASPFLIESGVSNPTGKMTLGQVSEVLFMLMLPVFLTRYGIKFTLLIGMFAWALRYLLFAYGNADELVWMFIVGIALHGICYDFFFVAGQIYTDSKAGEQYKSSAQGLLTLATYGLGMLIGFWAAGKIADQYASDSIDRWETIWLYPAGFALVVAIIFLLAFKDRLSNSESAAA